MSNSDILEHFPKKFVPRPIQKTILEKIDSYEKSGYKTIIVSAPTGVGKSPIAITLANQKQRSFIVTASKQLQDQYLMDFKFLRPVKGKSNFACFQLMDHGKIDKKDIQKAIQKDLTCDKGRCKNTTTKDGGKATGYCRYKPKINEVLNEEDEENPSCLYYKQKYEALLSDHSLWNYSSYFQLMKYSKDVYAEYIDRPIGIFDEAHTIENQITKFMGIDINAGNLEDCGIDIKAYDLSKIELVLMLLEDLANSYKIQIQQMQDSRAFRDNPNIVALTKLESKYERLSKAYVDISVNKENFVINDPKKDRSGIFKSLSISPLDISGYVQEFFDISLRVFMSATIDKDGFCETMGLNVNDVAFVDTPYSPFLPENRKIKFLNITKISKSRSTLDEELSVIRKIDEILTSHPTERGLILTSSKGRCNDILHNLSTPNKKRIKICHSMNDNGQTQNQVLQEHSKHDNSVLLSSSLWEGVDLKDDLSRFQIIAKTPYPPLDDKRTKLKMKKYPLWYKSQTVIKILQGFGRSIRNEKDWAITYVLDSSAQDLLNLWKNRIPQSFHDTIWPKR